MTDWATIHAVRGDDGVRRCGWSASAPEYIVYHDNEWGRPVTDDVRIYEKLCLEGFQSGLSPPPARLSQPIFISPWHRCVLA